MSIIHCLSVHTTLIPVRLHKVSVAPTNMVYLDDYYSAKPGKLSARRKSSYIPTKKAKSIRQSLKDIFFPGAGGSRSSTARPPFPALAALQFSPQNHRHNEESFPYKFHKPIQVR